MALKVANIPTSYYMTPAEQHNVMNGGYISIRSSPSVPSVWDASQEYRLAASYSFDDSYRNEEELDRWVKANRVKWLRAESEKKKDEEQKKKLKQLTPFERELREMRIGLIRLPEDQEKRRARERAYLRAVIDHDELLKELSTKINISYLFK